MSHWRDLFSESEKWATVNLLWEPERFIVRANEIITLLNQYEQDHDERRPDVLFAKFGEPLLLRRCLMKLQHLAREGQSITACRPELTDRIEAFQAEGWPYLNPLQMPSERKRNQQRVRAAQKTRAKKLPEPTALSAELAKVAAGPGGKRGASAIIAKRYGVLPDAVRKARAKITKKT